VRCRADFASSAPPADVSLAWQIATPEERNKLARQLFNKVQIENRTAVEVTPRPDLLPFLRRSRASRQAS
jgi:hypothetical protein